ncbi:hypothetical protein ACO0QE_000692 [Hanseniaspora vineae]
MSVALDRIDQVIKKEKAALFKPLIDDLLGSSEEDFLRKIDKIQEWDRSKDDLYVWIPVLNRMDTMLKNIIDENGLDVTSSSNTSPSATKPNSNSGNAVKSESTLSDSNPSAFKRDDSQTISQDTQSKPNGKAEIAKKKEIKQEKPKAFLTLVDSKVENKIFAITSFTHRLLQNTSNRSLYSSLDRMYCLLNCPNMKVKLGAMKVLAINAERVGKLNTQMKPAAINGPAIKKALSIALSLLCSHTNDSNQHYSLNDLMYRFCPKNNISHPEEMKKFPSKWRNLNYKYLSKKTNTVQYLKLNSSQLNQLSTQEVFNKITTENDIPESHWFELSIQVFIAKIFSTSAQKLESKDFYESESVFDAIDVLLQLKFYSIAYINCLLPSSQTSSKYFEIDSYIFECLNDFILVAMPKKSDRISLENIRFAALFALECISFKHIWCSDILRNLGGNMSHGAMFNMLKTIKKSLKDPQYQDYLNEDFNVRFFILISNLADVKQLHETLTANGLIQSLLDIISVSNKSGYRSLSSACNLLRVLISDFDTATQFFDAGGYSILVNSINAEVNFAIENPEFGTPTPYCKVYYSASFRQLSFLRGLLKQVLNLLSLDGSDRIRNLIDSSILQSLNSMLTNRPVFGFTLLAYALNVVQTMINSEPTVFPILVESETIKVIVENFESFIGPCSELLLVLPHVVSAICLNNDGLDMILKSDVVKTLFKPLTSLEMVKVLTVDDSDMEYGTELDELYRHHPPVQKQLVSEFLSALSTIKDQISFSKPLMNVNKDGSTFYKNSNEAVSYMDEAGTTIGYFDLESSGFIIRSFFAALACCPWKPLEKQINPVDIWDIIFVQNLPFDFPSSQTFGNICDTFSSLNEIDRQASVDNLLERLENTLDALEPFLDCQDSSNSFFTSAGTDVLQQMASNFSILNALLAVLTWLYFDYATLSFPKVKLILNHFQKEGSLKIIEKVAKAYKRVILEEQAIRACLPAQVEADTREGFQNQKGPIVFHKSKLPCDLSVERHNRTSAKFTNTYQIRYLCFFIQNSCATFFRSLFRLSNMKKNDMNGLERRKEVEIMEHTMKSLLQNFDFEESKIDANLSFLLSSLHTFGFIISNHNSTTTITKPRNLLSPIILSLFYRFNGHNKLFSLIEHLLQRIANEQYKSISTVVQHPVVYDKPNILVVGIINQALTLLKKTVKIESIEESKNIKYYLGSDLGKCSFTGLFLVNAKLLLVERSKLVFSKELLESLCNNKKLPDSVFNNLLDFFFCLFTKKFEEKNNDDTVLCYIQSDSVNPSKKKCDFLSTFDVPEQKAEILLLENDNELPPAAALELSENEQKRYDEALESEDLIKYYPEPMVRDEHVCELSRKARENFVCTLKDVGVVKLLSHYPNSAGFAAKLYDNMKNFSPGYFLGSQVLKSLLPELEENHGKMPLEELAPSIHTFSILLTHYFIPSDYKETVCDRFIDLFIEDFKPERANEIWFARYLYGFEGMLSLNIIPQIEELKNSQKIGSDMEARIDISEHSKNKIFDCLIKIKNLNSTHSALSVARVLLLFSRDYDLAKTIANSGILSVLLKSIGLNQKNEDVHMLENVFLLLVRACFETKGVVRALIENELRKYFQMSGLVKRRVLLALLMEKTNLILRDSASFLDVLCENTRFVDFNENYELHDHCMNAKENAPWDNDQQSSDQPKMTLDNKTGIVQLLFSQLIAAFKKDWISEVQDETDPLLSNTNKTSRKQSLHKNPVFAYISFLLRTLTEVVASYKQSKLELLCYSRRNTFGSPHVKPRTTFINFLLYQLIPLSQDIEDKAEAKKREHLSRLAKELILAFMVSVSRSKPATKEDKYVDPDMTFIRKFTIECIMKALTNSAKNITTNPESPKNIRSWFDLLGHILTIQFTAMFNVSETNSLNNDKFHFCKLMLEMNVPSSITSIMALLDLNHPQSKPLMNHSIEPLKLLSYIRDKHPEQFNTENQEEDEDVDVESDEENYDMFKNSALGMYEVDDIDEDEFDEESLLGDGDVDEDIAFVDDDGVEEEGLEAVFTDEEDEGIRSRRFEDVEDDGLDLESEGEVIYENNDILHDDEEHAHSDEDLELMEGEESDSDNEDDEDMISISDLDNEEQAILYEDEDEDDEMSHEERDLEYVTADDSPALEEINVELYDSQLEQSDWDSNTSDLISENDSDNMEDSFIDDEEEDDTGDDAEDNVFPDLLQVTGRAGSEANEVHLIRFDELNNIASSFFHPHSLADNDRLSVHRLLQRENRRHNHGVHNHRGSFGRSMFDNMNFPNERDVMSEFFLSPVHPESAHPLSGFNSVRSDFDLVSQPPNRTNGSGRFSPFSENGNLPILSAFFRDPQAGPSLKSTTSRWNEIVDMFYIRKSFSFNIVPAILNRILEDSLSYFKKKQSEAASVEKEKEKERMQKMKRDYSSLIDEEEEQAIISEEEEQEDEGAPRSHSYVQIGGQEVDVANTDIDPEYLNALPEELREEVFYQHVAEDRARRLSHRDSESHIRPGYLSTLPENIRSNILEQQVRIQSDPLFVEEPIARETSSAMSPLSTETTTQSSNVADESQNDTQQPKKKKSKHHFPPLVDRAGIFSILKSLFLPQPYLVREKYHEFFRHLSNSKQNRYDFLNLILFILIDGIVSKSSLDRVYNYICNKANQLKTSGKKNSFEAHHFQLPLDCTPTSVANQCIDALQALVDHNDSVKLFFVTEHDNLIVHKPISSTFHNGLQNSSNNSYKSEGIVSDENKKWPINYLFNLLSNRIVTDEVVLMDLLTKILQDCTKMMKNMAKSKKNKLNIPVIDEKLYPLTVDVLNLDSCNTKVFQQTLTVMLNLSIMNKEESRFNALLVESARSSLLFVIPELKEITANVDKLNEPDSQTSELITKFSSPISSQAKLLKVLTSIDFIATGGVKKLTPEATQQVAQKVEKIYLTINLGELWSCLSDCLSKFETKINLDNEKQRAQVSSVSYLLPLIESLMVVCKYSDTSEFRDSLSETDKHISSQDKNDLNALPLNRLFFHFTDSHKKLLNQMIRGNPKLMSGPFSVLIKNSKVLDFDNKRYYFMDKLSRDGGSSGNDVSSDHHHLHNAASKLPIEVTRDQVFLDSYRALFFKPIKVFKESKLDVTFKGEEGVDAGGVKREWYQSISKQMVNPDYALFLSASSDSNTFHPNRTSWVNPEHLSFFKFIGMIIGKSIRDRCFVDCYFSRAVYKQLLGIPVSLKDMESIDPDYYKSLVWILENDITDIIDLTFSVDTDDYGEHKIIDLIENGRDIAVTQENKSDYVTKIVEYKLSKSVSEQMSNLLQGFYSIIPKKLITIFNAKELELLVSGLPDIDVLDWKNNTQYVNYTASSREIGYFWRAVRSFSKEEKAKLLQFVTGTSKVPLNGFKELAGVNGVSKFSIHKDYGATDRLPQSHTCFNQLDLPAYESYEMLRKALLLAISEGHEGFGLA